MKRYHIGKDGMPADCTAEKGNCPLGGSEDHFTDKADAIERASELLEEKYGQLKSMRKETTYHVGKNGSVEECESPKSCDVKPYGVFKNYHSPVMDAVFGASNAYREANGKLTAMKDKRAESSLPDPTVATDPVTDAARTARGSLFPVGNHVFRRGDMLRGRDHNDLYMSETIKDEEHGNEVLGEWVSKGIDPRDIKVVTVDSCHHSSTTPDFSKIVTPPPSPPKPRLTPRPPAPRFDSIQMGRC